MDFLTVTHELPSQLSKNQEKVLKPGICDTVNLEGTLGSEPFHQWRRAQSLNKLAVQKEIGASGF